jgi:hypothetical protein
MLIGNGITGTITTSPYHHLDNRYYRPSIIPPNQPDTIITPGKSEQEVPVGSQSRLTFIQRASKGYIASVHIVLNIQYLEQN